MPKSGKVDARNIATHARKQIMQARSEMATSNYRVPNSSLGAVKKIRVSKQDPTVKTILEIINQ